MPQRKKHPRLPNKYGAIRYLGKGRSNPYAVHPPATQTDEKGNYIRPKALCYVDDWYVGFAVLNAYHAGTYQPGDELKFKLYRSLDNYAMDDFCKRILADFSAYSYAKTEEEKKKLTFANVFDEFYKWKFEDGSKREYSPQLKNSLNVAFKNCKALHNRAFVDLRHKDLQDCINASNLKRSSIKLIVSLMHQMYKYALLYEICDRDYSNSLVISAEDDEHGIPFTDEDLKILWKNKNNPTVEFILIMCYSGYRIKAYETIKVDTENWYFQGGVKNVSSKNRIVPIHSAIQSLVTARISRFGKIMDKSPAKFREAMYEALNALGIEKHTPHDCRHTFSRLCEKYGVNENDRRRMLGHSFGSDITNAIYGHRTLEELRSEIEKIKVDL